MAFPKLSYGKELIDTKQLLVSKLRLSIISAIYSLIDAIEKRYYSLLHDSSNRHMIPFMASHINDAIVNRPTNEPIFNVCPSTIIFNRDALRLYLVYLDKYLSNIPIRLHLKSMFAQRLFSDMCSWSTVFSYVNSCNPCAFIELDECASQNNLFIDHNIRCSSQNKVAYEMEVLNIPEQINYTGGKPELPLKKFQVDENGNFLIRQISGKTSPICGLHFCGVEAKYLLYNSHYNKLIS